MRLVVNAATGAIAQRLDYDSFGRVLADTAPGFQPFGLQSGLYDPDTGLVHFGARWYDASTGRWLSKDPILLEGGLNLYAFCGNDPVNFVDPLGLCEVVKDGGEYVNKYVNDLSKHPFNPFYVKGVVGENDIWRHKDDGIVYSYRDFIYAPDEMGNIGPAYAATMAWGPLNAAGAMVVAELYNLDLNNPLSSAYWSFYYNGIGITDAISDHPVQFGLGVVGNLASGGFLSIFNVVEGLAR